MRISTEFYSDKTDMNFVDVHAKSLWPFSTFVNQVLKFYHHFACSERLRKFPIKYGDLYICDRGLRKIDTVIIVAYGYQTWNEPFHEVMVLINRRPAKAQASLCISLSPEPSLFAYMKYKNRRIVRPKIRHIAPLDGCACAFEEWVYGGRKVP